MVKRAEPVSAARPTGTVTFLFSDIEGSTARWERDPGRMAPALARHDALMLATLEAHDGYVFKTIGDAFCSAFTSAPAALAAALAAQRVLGLEDFSDVDGLRVRMALHAGHADERGGDYFGPPVNRVARLLAIGHGGQVLVSGIVAELVRDQLPPDCSLRDLGLHGLKDLTRPEQVYQLVAPELLDAFPALRSLDALSNNLPRQLTSFVGREMVVRDLSALIERLPLVTIVGAGGVGKTRAAIQVGAELLDGSGDGVWLAELAPISDPALVANTIAQALDVRESPNRPLLETVLAYLKKKRLLLILDNCEHVIDEARRVVAAILHACPEVRILATSRESLNVRGEEIYRMPSLEVPLPAQTTTVRAVSEYGAVRLFSDRAFSVDKRFNLTDENASDVAEICRRLDGIPLAIELVAARVQMLAPRQLARLLDERFRLLTGGDRAALPRQQTMRALIDWSYDLLSERERTLFRRLSIFAGSFALETAGAVCKDESDDELAVFDRLSSLVHKSLVQSEALGDGTRYRLLESTREYAREKLLESGETDAIARAHAAAYLALAERLEDAYDTTPDPVWHAQAEPELENWRAALTWALTNRGDVLTGQRIAGALRFAWIYLAPAEGRGWVQRALEQAGPETPSIVVAKLDLSEAVLHSVLVKHRATYAAAERARTRFEQLGDERGVAEAQRLAGFTLIPLGRMQEGEALLQEALASSRRLGVRRLTGFALQNLAVARSAAGDIDEARTLYAEALGISQSLGAERSVANVALNLAEAEFQAGDAEKALQLAGEALAGYGALHDANSCATALSNMVAYLVTLDRAEDARVRAREALALSREAQLDVGIVLALQHFVAIAVLGAVDVDAHARAAQLLGYVESHFVALDAAREYTEQQEYDKIMVALRSSLGEERLASLIDGGRVWSEDRAVAEALLI